MAQLYLGVVYINGQGVPKDRTKGIEYYQKAAAQNNAHAEWRLGKLYQSGEGVPKYVVMAEKYFAAAKAHGYTE